MKAVRSSTTSQHFVEDSQGRQYRVPYEPTQAEAVDIILSTDGERALVAYHVQDESYSLQDEDDSFARIIVLNRDYLRRGDEELFAEAIGMVFDGGRNFSEPNPEDYDDPEDMPKANPDAMMLDVYIHSGAHIALSGSSEAAMFPDRRWDVSRGIWIPGEDLKKELEKLDPEARAKRREEAAEACIDEWNALESGDVWGCVIVAYRAKHDDEGGFAGWEVAEDVFGYLGAKGKHYMCNHESTWGFVGFKYAREELDAWVTYYTEHFLEKTGEGA